MVARSPLSAAALSGNDINRFWEKVSKADHPMGCWVWTAAGRGEGYGCLKVDGRVHDSHRLSWLIHFGDIASGLLVCHECDNRLCVRPDHLFLGSWRDNALDMFRKGRGCTGEKNGKAVLTDAQVAEIRIRRSNGERSCDLAAEFGVHPSTIRDYIAGKTRLNFPQPTTV